MKPRAFLPIMVALVGCGSQPGPLTPAGYCDQIAQDVCAAVSPACLVPIATCTTGQLVQCSAEAQANAGRDFIPSGAQACLSKVSAVYAKLNQGMVALSAADYQAMTEICSQVYRGTGVANAPCTLDADCSSGLICDKGYCGTATVVTKGAGCANIGEICPQGFYCSDASGVWVCSGKVGMGVACNASTLCLENLRCAAGVCSAQLGIGDACTADQDCSSGFCEPYAAICAEDVRFANGSAACIASAGP